MEQEPGLQARWEGRKAAHGPHLPDPLSPLCWRIPPGPGICCPLSCPLGSSQSLWSKGLRPSSPTSLWLPPTPCSEQTVIEHLQLGLVPSLAIHWCMSF